MVFSDNCPDEVTKGVHIGAYYPDTVHRSLKVLAAVEGRTQRDLLGEALDDLFQKYGCKSPVPAEMKRPRAVRDE